MEETPPKVFQLIDLDRTLFDTSAFVEALTDEVNETNPGYGTQLDERFEAAYKREETFFLLRELRNDKGNEWFESATRRVVQKVGAASLAMTGLEERIEVAEAIGGAEPRWGILTYGDAPDQKIKRALLGLHHSPMYIADTPDKGALIRSWQLEDGTFKLPGEFGGQIVDELTFEDDKLRAFQDLPDGVTSFWLTNKADAPFALAAKQQKGEVGHVTIVDGLPAVSEHLRKKYLSN